MSVASVTARQPTPSDAWRAARNRALPRDDRVEKTVLHPLYAGVLDRGLLSVPTTHVGSRSTAGTRGFREEQICKWGFSIAIVTACIAGAAGCLLGEVVTIGGVTFPCAMLATALCAMPAEVVHNVADCHAWAYRR